MVSEYLLYHPITHWLQCKFKDKFTLNIKGYLVSLSKSIGRMTIALKLLIEKQLLSNEN